MTVNYSYRLLALACALGTLHLVGACSSDQAAPAGDGGPEASTGTGGKHTGGAAGRPSTGGGTAGGAGGAAGAAGTSACTLAVATTCDGAEDCPSGKKCCGEYSMTNGYDKFGCYDSCAPEGGTAGGMPNPMGALVFELCHAGDTCEDATAMCLTSPYLPASLSRCLPSGVMSSGMPPNASLGKDPNAVNCGSAVCGAGEQCCIRQPLEPYCAPKGTTCTCDHTGGAAEAGAPEAGAPDASTPPAEAAPPQEASTHD